MKMAAGVSGAAVGGLIGAAAWAAISYFANLEIGWVASITGALAGLGFRLGFPRGGVTAGVLAALIGVAAIGAGKIAAIVMELQAPVASYDPVLDRELLVSYLADDVIEERRLAGEPVSWPGGARNLQPVARRDYDPEIWDRATERWDAMSDRQREVFAQDPEAPLLDELVVSYFADDVAREWALEGRAVDWPDGAIPFDETRRSWYPPDVWEAAQAEWDALSEAEKAAERAAYSTGAMSVPDAVGFAFQVLPYTVNLFDALWVILGVGAAYKIAAGDGESEVLPASG